jgi:hypothetical protein
MSGILIVTTTMEVANPQIDVKRLDYVGAR